MGPWERGARRDVLAPPHPPGPVRLTLDLQLPGADPAEAAAVGGSPSLSADKNHADAQPTRLAWVQQLPSCALTSQATVWDSVPPTTTPPGPHLGLLSRLPSFAPPDTKGLSFSLSPCLSVPLSLSFCLPSLLPWSSQPQTPRLAWGPHPRVWPLSTCVSWGFGEGTCFPQGAATRGHRATSCPVCLPACLPVGSSGRRAPALPLLVRAQEKCASHPLEPVVTGRRSTF